MRPTTRQNKLNVAKFIHCCSGLFPGGLLFNGALKTVKNGISRVEHLAIPSTISTSQRGISCRKVRLNRGIRGRLKCYSEELLVQDRTDCIDSGPRTLSELLHKPDSVTCSPAFWKVLSLDVNAKKGSRSVSWPEEIFARNLIFFNKKGAFFGQNDFISGPERSLTSNF